MLPLGSLLGTSTRMGTLNEMDGWESWLDIVPLAMLFRIASTAALSRITCI